MKVVFDFRIFFQQRYGGISRYFFEISKHLEARAGIRTSVLAPFFVNQYLREPSGLKVNGVYLPKLPRVLVPWVEKANYALSVASLSAGQPDILHETYYADDGLPMRKGGRITTVYDMIHEKFPQFYPNDPTARMKARSVARADHILCISKKTQDDLIEMLGVDRAKTSVVHLGCDFADRASTAGQRPMAEPYLLFVGPRGAHKNFRTLLTAYASSAKLARDFRLVCFGSTPFSADESEEFRRLGLGAASVIHVTGDDSLLPAYYAHARVFVYPSLYEGFGFPPLEAMSLGCATVASQAGSMPEVLGDAVVYFDPAKPDSLREVLERVAYDESWRRRASALGRSKAASYRWEDTAEKTLAVYRRFLG